jgi:hypothetical protein
LLGVKDGGESPQQKNRYRTHAAAIIAKRMRAALRYCMIVITSETIRPCQETSE